MDLQEYFIPIVLVACLVVGYCIKHSASKKTNKFIPTIMAALGAVLGILAEGLSLGSVVSGAVTGLASTGLYEAFTQYIEAPQKAMIIKMTEDGITEMTNGRGEDE